MTTIEQGYIDQGYVLPPGLTWESVAAARAAYKICDIYVPVVARPDCGCWAWGVPMRDGEFLSHACGEG